MMNQDNSNERTVIQQTNNFYGNIGQQINHVDKIEAHFDKDMGITVDGQDIMPSASSDGSSSPDEEWVDEIASCFFGNKKDALEFVGMARKLADRQITELVNAWLVKRRISDRSCNRYLWKPLHEHGIYRRTEQNWNSQVHIP